MKSKTIIKYFSKIPLEHVVTTFNKRKSAERKLIWGTYILFLSNKNKFDLLNSSRDIGWYV